MPKTLVQDETVGTPTFARFTAEPFEAGYGHTVGNSLRRVLLSSLEGAAITAVRINGAAHEFTHLENVVEDVTDIILNLKKIKFNAPDHDLRTLTIAVNKDGAVTAGDIQTTAGVEVLNPEQVICHARQEAAASRRNSKSSLGRGLSSAPNITSTPSRCRSASSPIDSHFLARAPR